MSLARQLRRLAGTAFLALVLTAGTAAATAGPAQANHSQPSVGGVVCHAGPVSGLQCGTVTATNLTIATPDGVITGVFRYSACSMPGDQGAPIFQFSSGNQIGTVVAGSGSCGFGGATFGVPLH